MSKIVVTGATGNIGRVLVPALAEADEEVIAVSRHPYQFGQGVRHLQADLAEPESLGPALEGANAVFLLVAGGGDGLDPAAILNAVKRVGAGRIVLVSSQAVGTRPKAVAYFPVRDIEHAVEASEHEWTILRSGGFDSNALTWAPMVRAERTVAAPFADIGLPTIDPADIAEVAAATLRQEGHGGRTYVLTGPALVSPRQQAQAIGDALGTPLRFVEQSRDEARTQMLQFMPEALVDSTLSILGDPLPTEQQVSHDIVKVLDREPRTFADWAIRNVEAFR
jgi:uncharacterized protein YbjT (DUF2867 family)